MSYVDGYVIPIPKNKVKEYIPMAKIGKKIWMKHGAVAYFECVGDDLNNKYGISFKKLAKAKPNETVVFSFVVYKNKAQRDKINAKVMKEMMKADMPPGMPFDIKKMAYGGFKAVVES